MINKCLAIVGTLLGSIVGYLFVDAMRKDPEPPGGKQFKVPIIPGLKPLEIVAALKQQGYSTKLFRGPDITKWQCIAKQGKCTYDIEIFGRPRNEETVTSIRGTVKGDCLVSQKKTFLDDVATLPFSGADAEAASDFVQSSFDKHSETTIGNIVLRLTVLKNVVSLNMRMATN